VPLYGAQDEEVALGMLHEVFPGRKVVGVCSRGFVSFGIAGGGSFHCITQQEPHW
jgi:agmatine deiminase